MHLDSRIGGLPVSPGPAAVRPGHQSDRMDHRDTVCSHQVELPYGRNPML